MLETVTKLWLLHFHMNLHWEDSLEEHSQSHRSHRLLQTWLLGGSSGKCPSHISPGEAIHRWVFWRSRGYCPFVKSLNMWAHPDSQPRGPWGLQIAPLEKAAQTEFRGQAVWHADSNTLDTCPQVHAHCHECCNNSRSISENARERKNNTRSTQSWGKS